MLLSGPLTHRAAGLANSVISRCGHLDKHGGIPVVFVDVFQIDFPTQVEMLRESGRLGKTTVVHNLFEDLRHIQRNAPLSTKAESLQLEDYEAKVDPENASIRRYYLRDQYVAFEREDLGFVDFLHGGKRYKRVFYRESTILKVAFYDGSNVLSREEYFDLEGVRCLTYIYRESKLSEIYYLDESLRQHKFSSQNELIAYWLINFHADVLREHALISEWAFKYDALVEVRKKLNCKLIITFHSSHLGYPYRYGAAAKPELVTTLGRIDDFDALVVLTQEQKFDLLKEEPGRENIHVIPHVIEGVANPEIERDQKKIVLVSRLDPNKGILAFAKYAIDHLDDLGEGVKIEVWGRGQDEKQLRQVLDNPKNDSIMQFRGFADSPRDVYSSAGVALFPSDYEGQSLALLEAIAYGATPVAYRFKYGASSSVRDGETGFLVDPGNLKELFDSAVLLTANVSLQSEMVANSERSRSRGRDSYRLFEQWNELFVALMESDGE